MTLCFFCELALNPPGLPTNKTSITPTILTKLLHGMFSEAETYPNRNQQTGSQKCDTQRIGPTPPGAFTKNSSGIYSQFLFSPPSSGGDPGTRKKTTGISWLLLTPQPKVSHFLWVQFREPLDFNPKKVKVERCVYPTLHLLKLPGSHRFLLKPGGEQSHIY